jgi:cytochrome b561
MDAPKRYHPVLVTLHWLIVVLVFTNLYLGLFIIEPLLRGGGAFRIPESTLAIHMAVGIAILVLIMVRFFIRTGTKKPAPATAGNKFFDVLARVVHYALYFFVFATTVIGLVFALQTNRLQRAFLGGGISRFEGGPGSGNFGGFPTPGPGTPQPSFGGEGNGNQPGGNRGFQGNGPRPGGSGFTGGRFSLAFFLLPLHLDIAVLLLFLIGFHILAALYHQFIRKDHLIGRMWYGKA